MRPGVHRRKGCQKDHAVAFSLRDIQFRCDPVMTGVECEASKGLKRTVAGTVVPACNRDNPRRAHRAARRRTVPVDLRRCRAIRQAVAQGVVAGRERCVQASGGKRAGEERTNAGAVMRRMLPELAQAFRPARGRFPSRKLTREARTRAPNSNTHNATPLDSGCAEWPVGVVERGR